MKKEEAVQGFRALMQEINHLTCMEEEMMWDTRVKMCIRDRAKALGGEYQDYNFIIAHLGGGISVGTHKKGRLVDVNNSLDGDGPMSCLLYTSRCV